MNKAYLSLGSNRGNRESNLKKSIELLNEWAGEAIQASSLYETPPWKMDDDTDFFNQVVLLQTTMTPAELIDTIILIEVMMGRTRSSKKYEPRIIDIDILFFNSEIINSSNLVIPHPLLQERRFVLEPMVEITPDFVHPVFKKNMMQLLGECSDKSEVRKLVSK